MRQILIVCLCLCCLGEVTQGQSNSLGNRKKDTTRTPAYTALAERWTQAASQQDSFVLLMDLGKMSLESGHNSSCLIHYQQAYNLSKSIGRPEALATSTLAMTKILRITDQYDSLYQYCLRAIEIGEKYAHINQTWLASIRPMLCELLKKYAESWNTKIISERVGELNIVFLPMLNMVILS